jgi:phospholipase/carboxylesterase
MSTLRVRTVGAGDGPAIILCHGYGAPGDDLVGLARAIDAGPGTRWFFPEAPLEVDVGFGEPGRAQAEAKPSAFGWWPVDMLRLQMELARGGRQWDPEATPEGLDEAREQLVGCLRALIANHKIDPARAILGGFSQGAMLTTDVALTEELGFTNVAILSGSLIRRAAWTSALGKRKLHVLQSHGRGDPILPFAIAEELHRTLVAAGSDASFIHFQGGHEIRPNVLDAIGRFARARLHAG